MAALRRGQPELHVRMPSTPGAVVALPDLPPISALFLIDFDVKAGYTISWKASKPGIELEGVVEYKSLPSGLHTVSEDLIYFVHDEYAGLSAFINAPVEDTAARNARMLAVGVLVPLSYGRLGRAWKHAESLKAIASKLVLNSKNVKILEDYWDKNRTRDSTEQNKDEDENENDSPTATFQTPKKTRSHTRNRSASDGTALMLPGHRLSPFHPAWSLTKLLDTFGPLIFPIHRAALLRKRILISGHAPVEEACNFVYDISILSNIPLATFDLLSPNSPSHRLRPLFSIGVHDMPFLTEDAKRRKRDSEIEDEPSEELGWIACTTDSILSKKDTLWDMLITMPPSHAVNANKHVWPTLESPLGVPVRATQRDLRRFRSLKVGLARLEEPAGPATPGPASRRRDNDMSLLDDVEQIVEPTSWTALAYSGFMWWASAGEKQRADESEEATQDAALLADPSISMGIMPSPGLSNSIASLTTPRRSSTGASAALIQQEAEEAGVELVMIAYFHRLTTQILSTLTDVIESGTDESDLEGDDDGDDDDDDATTPSTSGDRQSEGEGGEDDALLSTDSEGRQHYRHGIRIDVDVVKRMGLDVWSASDAEFVTDLLRVYFGRSTTYVEGKGVEVCGIRVC
ncbi:hypothetical protein F5Y16DRAFT_360971 [Xylariaceae sp. FL0255]|nr:hypothetical protein F5Y16DRAFT_360971 [Xylariaceae sp. FL0255]